MLLAVELENLEQVLVNEGLESWTNLWNGRFLDGEPLLVNVDLHVVIGSHVLKCL